MSEELWNLLGHNESISNVPWPKLVEDYLKSVSVKYPVSFNGKTRFQIELDSNLDKNAIETAVLETDDAKNWLDGQTPKKVIVVPGRIVNIVV